MVSAKRIYADFRVFSVGYLRNKFGLFFGLIFPVVLISDFRRHLFWRQHRNSHGLCPESRHGSIYGNTT